ncbi:MAG TPA: ankyrin repeat domain-containing protein [Fimbriimonadaceae bacterium]|nr:ankyrin repeat domain-containing protein [Fimbriimonadaceae bacterium]
MSTPLPERASLDQLRKQAKDLRKSGEYAKLADAQFAVAREYGFPSWPKMAFAVEQRELQAAIRDGLMPELERLLKANPRLAKAPYEDGSTPLHQAGMNNDPAMIERLVKAGAPFRTRYATSGHTALSWAITCWSPEAALKLVELGDMPDLFCAAGLGLLDHVQAFWVDGKLRRGASRTGSSRRDETGERLPCPPTRDEDIVSDALYIACRSGRLETARWLLDHGADPNWRGFIGANCLAWAEFSDMRELCDLLRERGASDEIRDTEFGARPREFPIMVLAGWGFQGWLSQRLAKYPESVRISAGCGTALHAAAMNGQSGSAKILLEAGADRQALDPAGRTASEVAQARGFGELAQILR